MVDLALGFFIAYASNYGTKPLQLTHAFTGIVIVALIWFLGVAQATVKGGSLRLTLATFVVGLGVTLIGMAQVATPAGAALVTIQIFHIAFVLSAIAVGELCGRRYRTGATSQAT